MGGCPCFIVPPGLLERAARRGTDEDREAAISTLAVDAAIRAARQQHALTVDGVVPHALARPGLGRPRRTIFDAHHTDDVNAGSAVRSEGQAAVSDAAVNQAYAGLGDTYSFYWDVLHRDSIDDAGMPLLGEVHFGRGYDNAFWDGQRMIFGDGDGRLFTGFTEAIDVIGHELTHGVTQYTLNLNYMGQSGALNESISDVFGSLVKQYRLRQTAEQADWLIGNGILGPALHGSALRSMKAPGTAFDGDTQPATMAHYVHTIADNGGVHTNSGIPNHAFYLLAVNLGGQAWERAGRIWYETMASRAVPSRATFAAFALATIRSAQHLFGHDSAEGRAVAEAWSEVGVLKTVKVAV